MTNAKKIKDLLPKVTLTRVKRFLPILQWLPLYTRNDLQHDVVAGLPVGLLCITHGIIHAVVGGLPPQYGLYTSFPTMFLYMLFGTCKDLSIGTTVVAALLTSQYSITDETNPQIASALAFLVGICILLIALLKLGFIVRFMSHTVISAFVSASSVIIVFIQFFYLLGIRKQPRPFYKKLEHLFLNIKHTRLGDVILGCSCIVFLVLLQRFATMKVPQDTGAPKWKKILVRIARVFGIGRSVVISFLGIFVAYLFHVNGMDDVFITVGTIPEGLPAIKMPLKPIRIQNNQTIGIIGLISGFGSGLAVLPFIVIIQTIAISKALGRKNNYKVDPLQEIIAVGIGNVLTSLFSGFTVTASFGRSAVNNLSGTRTCLSGFVASLTVVIAIQFAAPMFRYIPYSALAAVSIAAMVKLFDYQLVKKLWKVNKVDLFVWCVSFGVCLYQLEIGILVGIFLSVCLILYDQINPDFDITTEDDGRTLIMALKGGMRFLGKEAICNKLSSALDKKPHVVDVVIDCSNMFQIDYTVVQGFLEINADLALRGIRLKFVNPVDQKVRRHLEKFHLIETNLNNLDDEDDDSVNEGENLVNGGENLVNEGENLVAESSA